MMPSKLRVKLASECNDILSKVDLKPSNKAFKYYLIHSKDLSEPTFTRLFKIFETLMKDMYTKSSWGWNEKEKMSEWKHSRSRFLIVTKAESQEQSGDVIFGKQPTEMDRIIGFMCFRFEDAYVKNECAFYVYEIHIEPDHQRQGIGEDLMSMARHMAEVFKMDKILLTAFKYNTPALKFYKKLHFKPDEKSPSLEEADYIILGSKV